MTAKKGTKKPAKSAQAKPREPERDYSHRALIDKLGVHGGRTVVVLGVGDAVFLDELVKRVPAFSTALQKDADLIFFAAEDKSDLGEMKTLAGQIAKDGAIWVVYPRGQTQIRESDVIAAGRSAGLTDQKVCRFSETHTALRFSIPLANRS
jgi:hypothetical protein